MGDDILTSYEREQQRKKDQEAEERRLAAQRAVDESHRKTALKKAEQDLDKAVRDFKQAPPPRSDFEAMQQIAGAMKTLGEAKSKVTKFSS